MGPPYGKRDPYYGTHIFRDSNMAVGLGHIYGALLGSHVLGGSLKIPLKHEEIFFDLLLPRVVSGI